MINQPLDNRPKEPSLWIFVAGFAVAALLTLTAAVGTSMLHRPTTEPDKSFEAPVAQR